MVCSTRWRIATCKYSRQKFKDSHFVREQRSTHEEGQSRPDAIASAQVFVQPSARRRTAYGEAASGFGMVSRLPATRAIASRQRFSRVLSDAIPVPLLSLG